MLKRFGASLQRIRHQAKLTQEELAFRAQLDRTYIGGIERGERNVSLINIRRIANALEVTLADLFEAMESNDA